MGDSVGALDQVRMQLELRPESVTVRANIFEGVLTVKTFEGPDCYKQMLTFIRMAYPNEKSVTAMIVLE